MDNEELKKIAILAKTKANLDVDVIKLWMRYHDKIQKLDDIGDKKADELEVEWKHIFKGFVQLFLPHDLSDENYDYVMNYLWPEQEAKWS